MIEHLTPRVLGIAALVIFAVSFPVITLLPRSAGARTFFSPRPVRVSEPAAPSIVIAEAQPQLAASTSTFTPQPTPHGREDELRSVATTRDHPETTAVPLVTATVLQNVEVTTATTPQECEVHTGSHAALLAIIPQ